MVCKSILIYLLVLGGIDKSLREVAENLLPGAEISLKLWEITCLKCLQTRVAQQKTFAINFILAFSLTYYKIDGIS